MSDPEIPRVKKKNTFELRAQISIVFSSAALTTVFFLILLEQWKKGFSRLFGVL